ncbi:hypothetical protein GF325_02295, partial [Candidatus Bathyarchaeota archaeon]|nr:hypothetical protein [Candidatus Bathyarchaeota archaeon]
VGARGQVVIPKEARDLFKINPGDLLLVAGDINKGIAFSKVEGLKGHVMKVLGALSDKNCTHGNQAETENQEMSDDD